jgi:hypothetical protein
LRPLSRGSVSPIREHQTNSHVISRIEGRARDLAMFNLAIDSKLRGCDVVAIRVEDVAASGYAADVIKIRDRQ